MSPSYLLPKVSTRYLKFQPLTPSRVVQTILAREAEELRTSDLDPNDPFVQKAAVMIVQRWRSLEPSVPESASLADLLRRHRNSVPDLSPRPAPAQSADKSGKSTTSLPAPASASAPATDAQQSASTGLLAATAPATPLVPAAGGTATSRPFSLGLGFVPRLEAAPFVPQSHSNSAARVPFPPDTLTVSERVAHSSKTGPAVLAPSDTATTALPQAPTTADASFGVAVSREAVTADPDRDSDLFYFYQAEDGQPIYLCNLNSRCLEAVRAKQMEEEKVEGKEPGRGRRWFEASDGNRDRRGRNKKPRPKFSFSFTSITQEYGKYSACPPFISAKVVEVLPMSMTAEVRKRMSYLALVSFRFPSSDRAAWLFNPTFEHVFRLVPFTGICHCTQPLSCVSWN